jgi:streptomycin 6-kinase
VTEDGQQMRDDIPRLSAWRFTTLLAAPASPPGTPLPLSGCYPRPRDDNGRGMHWIPTTSQSPDTAARAQLLGHSRTSPEDSLADRVVALSVRWELALEARFPDTPGSPGNFVAPAQRADGTRCVLKVSSHIRETRQEIAALAFWNGRGAARLLAAEPDLGALLLERIEPGNMLVEVSKSDDDAATRAAADVVRELWRPASEADGLRSLASWCAAFDRNREVLSRGVAGFPGQLFQRADALRSALLASTVDPVALHGDLHHFNVLRSDRAGWLAIDPKGLAGDRCFDVCQFLRNPEPTPPSVNRRRLNILCDELRLDPRRTRDWCLVHAVLDACWDFEHGDRWEPKVAYAEQTLLF